MVFITLSLAPSLSIALSYTFLKLNCCYNLHFFLYSDKSAFKKELNREPLYGGSSGSASPAPSDYAGGAKCLPTDDLLATEV